MSPTLIKIAALSVSLAALVCMCRLLQWKFVHTISTKLHAFV